MDTALILDTEESLDLICNNLNKSYNVHTVNKNHASITCLSTTWKPSSEPRTIPWTLRFI